MNETVEFGGAVLHTHTPGKRSEIGGEPWIACADLGCRGWRFRDSSTWEADMRPTRRPPQKKAPEHETPILAAAENVEKDPPHPVADVVVRFMGLSLNDKVIAFDILENMTW